MDLELFAQEGYAYVRGAVSADVMDALNKQVAAELLSPSIAAESGEVAVALDQPETWPSGEARRVVEVTPPGGGAHWEQLVSSPKLIEALDAILGKGAWELPVNGPAPVDGGRVEVRHWYAPIAFPSEAAASAAAASTPAAAASTPAAAAWTPINRRGVLWRGFHLDIGPGFDTDELRTLAGHPFQGCVILLLGSEWTGGGGGTALVRGSHRWVHAALKHAGEVKLAWHAHSGTPLLRSPRLLWKCAAPLAFAPSTRSFDSLHAFVRGRAESHIRS